MCNCTQPDSFFFFKREFCGGLTSVFVYSLVGIPRGFAPGMNANPERAERAEVEQTFPTAQRKRSGRNTSRLCRGVVYLPAV